MKNLLVQFTLIISFLFVSHTTISAQKYSKVSYKTSKYADIDETIRSRVLVAKATLEYAGYTVIDSDADYLKEGEYYSGERTCYKDNEYIVMAFSGNGIYDLDLYLYDGYGNEITKSIGADDDGVAVLKYAQYRTSNMIFEVRNYDSVSSRKAYPMIIMVAYR